MKCIDLREAFPRLRLKFSQDHAPGSTVDPWDLYIHCQYGQIYPHGETKLQAYCASGKIRSKLVRLPGVQVWQEGDHETTVVFDVKDAGPVLKLLRARSKRSAETGDRLKKWREEQIRAQGGQPMQRGLVDDHS